jgi:hypothetical protein
MPWPARAQSYCKIPNQSIALQLTSTIRQPKLDRSFHLSPHSLTIIRQGPLLRDYIVDGRIKPCVPFIVGCEHNRHGFDVDKDQRPAPPSGGPSLIEVNLTSELDSDNWRRLRSAAAARLPLDQKIARSYEIQAKHCLRACKVLGRDRTKMFHVKHF